MLKFFMQFQICDDLTVIIPLYNKAETIGRALQSVLDQVAMPRAILVVDDGSQDNSIQIVREFQKEHSQIQLVEQENQGVSAARNKGAMESKTTFIAFLDADDEWLPEHTTNLQLVISTNQEADFFCLPYVIDSPKGNLKPRVTLPDSFNGLIDNFVQTYSNGYGLIHSSSVCFRRSFFFKVGGFPVGENSGEDLYLWLKSGLDGVCAAINRRSVILHKEDIGSQERRKKYVPYHVSYFSEHLKEYSPEQRGVLKNFLTKNILLQWAAAKIEKNPWQRKILRSYMYELNKVSWLLLLFSEMIPARLFNMIRNRRIKSRLNQ
jgi:glycosyltransferase involved in cell wall biosynthesis